MAVQEGSTPPTYEGDERVIITPIPGAKPAVLASIIIGREAFVGVLMPVHDGHEDTVASVTFAHLIALQQAGLVPHMCHT